MPKGGARPGAGRKPGGSNTATKERIEIQRKAVQQGITPLEVMLNAMREYHAAGEMDKACQVAAQAAPYCHSKFSTIEQKAEVSARVEGAMSVTLAPMTTEGLLSGE